ncbi:uncharacterized protein [Paramormyrops kingsleyae]|uniref:uncharacterized protein isoform X2 n=1 Tax=Paramormyrops kingsleyae TaxID=1676925 RepID=UPI003B97825E
MEPEEGPRTGTEDPGGDPAATADPEPEDPQAATELQPGAEWASQGAGRAGPGSYAYVPVPCWRRRVGVLGGIGLAGVMARESGPQAGQPEPRAWPQTGQPELRAGLGKRPQAGPRAVRERRPQAGPRAVRERRPQAGPRACVQQGAPRWAWVQAEAAPGPQTQLLAPPARGQQGALQQAPPARGQQGAPQQAPPARGQQGAQPRRAPQVERRQLQACDLQGPPGQAPRASGQQGAPRRVPQPEWWQLQGLQAEQAGQVVPLA